MLRDEYYARLEDGLEGLLEVYGGLVRALLLPMNTVPTLSLPNEPTWRCHQNPFIGALGIQEPVIPGEPLIKRQIPMIGSLSFSYLSSSSTVARMAGP